MNFLDKKLNEFEWIKETYCGDDDTIHRLKLPDGSRITVLDRLTGWGDGDVRDIETGYKDPEGRFWLASGHFDIREYNESVGISISLIIANANNCKGEF